MPTAYILVGVPGSGKSTWTANQNFDQSKTVIASTDNHVEKYAREMKKTYGEVFKDFMPRAVNLMIDDVLDAFEHDFDLVWDQTSTTIATRAKKLRMIPVTYQKIAVVFATPPVQVLMNRLAGRPGKEIPWTVVSDMIKNLENPTAAEGFDKIIHVQ